MEDERERVDTSLLLRGRGRSAAAVWRERGSEGIAACLAYILSIWRLVCE